MPLSQVQLDILSLLKKAKNVLVLPSSPIDADSIGSALAFYLALKKLGKTVTIIAEEAIPENYSFLPEVSVISHDLDFVRDFIVTIDCRDLPPENIRHEIQGNKVNIFITPKKGKISKEQVSFSEGGAPFDCIVTVDAADPSQFKKVYENFTELFHLVPVINIDHHTSNNSFGKINHIDVMASSTTTLVMPLIEELGQNLMDADIATLLLAGLITDTGSFQNPNTTPDAFAVAAKLIGYGARQQEIIRNIYKTKKLSTLRLWGRTLTKIQYDEQHRLVWSVLTAKDFAEIGGSPDETEGVIDELMGNAPNTEVIFLLKEKGQQEVSGSIRTLTPTIDASKLAALFGGGGHMQAAGFKVFGKSIQEVEQMVVAGIRDAQKQRLRIPVEEKPVTPVQAPVTPAPIAAPAPVAPAPKPPIPVATPTPVIPPAPTLPPEPVVAKPAPTPPMPIQMAPRTAPVPPATPVMPFTPPIAGVSMPIPQPKTIPVPPQFPPQTAPQPPPPIVPTRNMPFPPPPGIV
ncbi:MAG: DHH family phosphoesterase [Patescibacteria group bacterium]